MADDNENKGTTETTHKNQPHYDTETRKKLFSESIENLHRYVTPKTLGAIFGLGDNARYEIERKCRSSSYKSSRSPTRSDVLAVQLLETLAQDGYKLEEMEFDDDEKLLQLPRD